MGLAREPTLRSTPHVGGGAWSRVVRGAGAGAGVVITRGAGAWCWCWRGADPGAAAAAHERRFARLAGAPIPALSRCLPSCRAACLPAGRVPAHSLRSSCSLTREACSLPLEYWAASDGVACPAYVLDVTRIFRIGIVLQWGLRFRFLIST